jgi:hypothetical protein
MGRAGMLLRSRAEIVLISSKQKCHLPNQKYDLPNWRRPRRFTSHEQS